MKEIKCPKCGEIFTIDEASYATIAKQVRDKEFREELKERESRFEAEKDSALHLTKLELEKEFESELNKKESEILLACRQ